MNINGRICRPQRGHQVCGVDLLLEVLKPLYVLLPLDPRRMQLAPRGINFHYGRERLPLCRAGDLRLLRLDEAHDCRGEAVGHRLPGLPVRTCAVCEELVQAREVRVKMRVDGDKHRGLG